MALGCVALAACMPLSNVGTTPEGQPSGHVAPPMIAPQHRPEIRPLSAESQALKVHYTRVQNDLLVQGLLRRDGGGPDTPYNARMLAENFVQVALYDEYVSDGVSLRAETTQSRLRRWNMPVRMSVHFGDTVPLPQRAQDTADVARYGERLERASGLPIAQVQSDANFHVLILNEDDRAGYETRLRQMVPGIAESSVRAFMNLDRSTLCLVLAFSSEGSPNYTRAVALIRGEHPDLLRLSCIHEELAQGLGLANDSPRARPSIFNDDEEFGLLTTHDEQLLRILYDTRLTPGMTPDQATPIVRQIARELLDTPS